MKLVIAVSGGVDSVVLLDMLAREAKHDLVVAHFDHGIREDSAEDGRFVAKLAKKYNLPFEVRREELGRGASEELARTKRYAFLRGIAARYGATIATAHHMNDIAETIAINIARGTGWRGVAVLASDVYRPLLGVTKSEIVDYAKKNKLAWREDSTNTSDAYMRNRLRKKLTDEDSVLQLAALRSRQIELRDAIDHEAADLLAGVAGGYSRYFFTHVSPVAAMELLRAIAVKELGHSLPRPQLERLLLAIKTARPGSTFAFGAAWLVVERSIFTVKTP